MQAVKLTRYLAQIFRLEQVFSQQGAPVIKRLDTAVSVIVMAVRGNSVRTQHEKNFLFRFKIQNGIFLALQPAVQHRWRAGRFAATDAHGKGRKTLGIIKLEIGGLQTGPPGEQLLTLIEYFCIDKVSHFIASANCETARLMFYEGIVTKPRPACRVLAFHK